MIAAAMPCHKVAPLSDPSAQVHQDRQAEERPSAHATSPASALRDLETKVLEHFARE
jgi:hypothetical protein